MSESRCNIKIHCDVFLFACFVSRLTTEAKVKAIAIFQYKIILNILCTSSLLYKMKKTNTAECPLWY